MVYVIVVINLVVCYLNYIEVHNYVKTVIMNIVFRLRRKRNDISGNMDKRYH